MQVRTNTILIFAYGVIAVTVMSLVFWSGTQHRKTEQLIARLNEAGTAENEGRVVTEESTAPRRSMRPALVRLQKLLDQRSQLIHEQQEKIALQRQGRKELQQEHEELSEAYEQLQNEHQLLANEMEFYLGAFSLALGEEFSEDGSGAVADDAGALPGQTPPNRLGAPGESLLGTEAVSPLELELAILRQELEDLNSKSKRDALVASYASLAMVELGMSAVPLLSDILDDPDAQARAWAAWVLGQIGPDAAIVSEKLQRLLDDANADVARAAAEALRSINRTNP